MRDFENLKSGGKPVLITCNNNDNPSSGDFRSQWLLDLLPKPAWAAELANLVYNQ